MIMDGVVLNRFIAAKFVRSNFTFNADTEPTLSPDYFVTAGNRKLVAADPGRSMIATAIKRQRTAIWS